MKLLLIALLFIKLSFSHSVLDIINNSYVVPYFLNLTAINLLPSDPEKVKSYIRWYLDHLNYPDKYGLTGTIYDYYITENSEVPLYTYDSADSYSATFLFLTYLYAERTNDYQPVRENLRKLKDVAYVIAYLQDTDGLIKALPYVNLKYLVDNIEDVCGLRAFSLLLWKLKDPDWHYYFTLSHNVESSVIKNLMWRGSVAWAKLDDKLFIAGNSVVYPDLYAKAVFYSFLGRTVPDEWASRFDYFQRTVMRIVKNRCFSIRSSAYF
ncbi:hypothetical protein [Hydrogenobacter hydrogenophilus]|uniref:Uncharacterized protein n=1 Tax=Hydrogenobacter hydrogenophilus TaxID=35835 RepID=A0A285NTP6_9AQUI|nr:hypothetical protein [Hydrogenobacter hydrogenophilus]SNZ11256.1 hypothetical protein SAMN06265353_0182 [Hydrogenobacter hydrogenophilus]